MRVRPALQIAAGGDEPFHSQQLRRDKVNDRVVYASMLGGYAEARIIEAKLVAPLQFGDVILFTELCGNARLHDRGRKRVTKKPQGSLGASSQFVTPPVHPAGRARFAFIRGL